MGRILGSVDRRGFLRATGSAAAVSLSGRLGLARTRPELGALHRLVEETPHERVAAELAGLIRDGLDHRRTLTALAIATSRRVQPFPHVGFKYHTVLALQSVHLTALNLPDKERWLPVFWALDYFCAILTPHNRMRSVGYPADRRQNLTLNNTRLRPLRASHARPPRRQPLVFRLRLRCRSGRSAGNRRSPPGSRRS